jgi:hypothetical protein
VADAIRKSTPLNFIFLISWHIRFPMQAISVDIFHIVEPSRKRVVKRVAYTANREAMHSNKIFHKTIKGSIQRGQCGIAIFGPHSSEPCSV